MSDYLPLDNTLQMIYDYFKPSEMSLIEKSLTMLCPTMKELLLYLHITDSFRREAITFEGDAKFWEFFIRETLNQLVANKNLPKSSQKAKLREKYIDKILSLDLHVLRQFFSKSHSVKQKQFSNVISEDFVIISE